MPLSQSESIENRLKQLHEYNRQIAQLIIAWFTFFVTVNCAMMGWLLVTLTSAKQIADSHHSIEQVLPLIVVLFALENILGICACFVVRSHFLHRAALTHKIEATLVRTDSESSVVSDFQTVPVGLYSKALWLMTFSLIFLLLAWFSFLFIF
jgi:Mn2+/Fe2+ NRAMP family transporter